ncbi:acid phosphatase/Vanadium-dependent haloperoxidase [Basidiobolus meristosporus CBS 931.73]|uniref:Acid phosphatase/Vanadium-dependent haloperoxidase n=1 Tax=Basidiobolus meristosporus CBS 931.73 TaxID=1314790 RepID=A0A1Y1YHZ6_9FUNG|nr:acid phosphatase/Vanadium-dependent haloperoxidase [Basidiobolus meristosporus CBS 931.73]|eukprot:ORX97661.1 acid phosphatase/Vanadium-dependent haloperoxidase [Basidiobolus meristosporus CBS 931.73]
MTTFNVDSLLRTSYPRPHLRKLILSYGVDWILVGVFSLGFWLFDYIPPFHRKFSLTDKTISYPFALHGTVPNWQLFVFSFLVPLVILSAVALAIRRSPYDCHSALLGLCFCMSLTLLVTHILKTTIGRLRPDFIDRCQPTVTQDAPLGLSGSEICAQADSKILLDGMKSFPSGHTSLSFAGLTFLSLYLAGKLHLFDERGHTYKSFICVAPMIGAALIGVSRICDYRHHWQDVVVGALIGMAAAYYSYRQYYPHLGSPRCDKPFPPRIPNPFRDKYREDTDRLLRTASPLPEEDPDEILVDDGHFSSPSPSPFVTL